MDLDTMKDEGGKKIFVLVGSYFHLYRMMSSYLNDFCSRTSSVAVFTKSGGSKAVTSITDALNDEGNSDQKHEEASKYDHLTPAERKYLQQWEKINVKRLAKEATKSHRHRIQEFNQYLANLSEHYDIPKVGPG